MATRSEKLNRLVIQSPCTKSWDEMTGGDAERHCAKCDRQVFDFRQMTPRQMTTRLQATGGHLCAGLTRDSDGRLLTLEPPFLSAAPSTWTAHRASPVAAAVVSTLLGLGAACAKPLPQTPPAAAGSSDGDRAPAPDAKAKGGGGHALLYGVVADERGAPQVGFQVLAVNTLDGQQHSTTTTEDGAFAFDNLGAGVYAVDVSSDTFNAPPVADVLLQPGESRQVGLTVSPKVDRSSFLLGAIAITKDPLRQIYRESELVALATVGKTRALHDDSGEVATELSLDLTFKGRAPRSVRVYHYAPSEGEGLATPPGTKVLVLLDPREGESGPAYEFTDYFYGLLPLSEAELPVYRERLLRLARLSDAGQPHPADLAEWLVATAEEPLTRKIATSEISDDLAALGRFAEAKSLSVERAADDLRAVVTHFVAEGKSFENEPAPEMVAAFLTDAQRQRLVEALVATHTRTEADFELYRIARAADPDATLAWLTRTVRELKPSPADSAIETLDLLAAELDSEKLKSLVAAARTALEGIDSVQPDEPTPDQASLRDARYAAVDRELIRNFQEALDAPR
ncbi:MAG TPA: carboxypeptidase-like regulatory domain-containing protein [Thermoanaerobaculia bacterium]|nr:carboxypeptidase-like regulatory domain-containing protein [Thermoanaerobaculia bacterium]